jgi:DNA-binding transcriptional LysR family regulator
MIQMRDPLENAELLAFTKTVDAQSLSRAAAELGVPRATIGRRLARLEQRLGVRLLRRTTRSLKVTDAGEALYRHARIVLDAVKQAEASVRRTDDEIRGDLRVSVPPLIEESFFEMISTFAETHPHVRMQVHLASRHVDLRRDGYDVAFRAAVDIEPGLVARTLARSKLLGVAAPRYVAKHGMPRKLEDLRRHRLLVGFARGELPQTHWQTLRGPIRVEGSMFSNDPRLLGNAALRGLGIALLPDLVVDEHLDSGALVRVLPGILEVEHRMAVVYPERELVPPQVRAFVDALTSWMPELLGRAGHGPPSALPPRADVRATPKATKTKRAPTR